MRRMKTLPEAKSLTEKLVNELRDAMNIRGITQSELARRMDLAPPTVCLMLNGKTNISVETIERLAAAIGIEVSFLISNH